MGLLSSQNLEDLNLSDFVQIIQYSDSLYILNIGCGGYISMELIC